MSHFFCFSSWLLQNIFFLSSPFHPFPSILVQFLHNTYIGIGFLFSAACCFSSWFLFFRALTTGRLSTTHRTISSEFQLVFQDFADLIFLRIHLHLLIFLRLYLLVFLGTLYTCTSAARETRRFMGLNQDSRFVLFSLKHNQEYLMTALIKSGKARI